MNMAIPVIGYDVGAIPEIVDDSSLIAPVDDAVKLAEIAIDLLDNRGRRIEIGERNRTRAKDLFSVDAMIAQYRTLYAEALRRSRP
jgi:glycosyltransferase involved in cell wall biosynthesis